MINLNELKEGLRGLNLDQDKENKKIEEQLLLNKVENEARINFLKSVGSIKGGDTEILREKFLELDNLIEVLAKSSISGLIVVSNGGYGKSYKVLKKLGEMKRDWSYFSVFSTPLELYHTLYENNGKIIVLDDVEGLLNNEKIMSILKSALWGATGTRILNYKSTSDLLKAPKQFEFTGKLIILTNKIGNDINLKALVSRVLFCDLKFTYDEILTLMNEIAEKDYEGISLIERKEVLHYIKENSSICTTDFNLRVLIKAFEVRKAMPSKWKEIVKNMLQEDESMRIVREINLSHKGSVKEQIEEFSRRTGLGRRTYFTYKKRLGL